MVDVPLMVLDNAPDDGQTKAGAALPGALTPVELLEDARQVAGGYAFTVVGDLDVDRLFAGEDRTPSQRPAAAYLIALSTRLSKTCTIMTWSARTNSRVGRQV